MKLFFSMKSIKEYLLILIFFNNFYLPVLSNPSSNELFFKRKFNNNLFPKSEINDSTPEKNDPISEIIDPKPEIIDPKPEIIDPKPEKNDPKSNLVFNVFEDYNQLKLLELGKNIQIKQSLNKNTLNLKIYGEIIKIESQSISKPSEGIELAAIKSTEEMIDVNIMFSDFIDLSTININQRNDQLIIKFKKSSPQIVDNSDIFKIRKIFNNESKIIKSRASAPPLGDIATGTTIIPNPNLLNLEGPEISLVFKQTSAKKAIQFLLSKTNYSFVWVQKDPSYNSSTPISTTSLNNNPNSPAPTGSSSNPASVANNQLSALSPTQGAVSQASQQAGQTNADTPRLITLSIENKSFATAFNSILIASGLQARKVNDIIFVGPNVRDTAFTERISKVYRLNQTSANAAASYLANLGAKVTRTSTITTAVSTGASQASSVGASSSTTSSGTSTTVQVYGSGIGPLVGLIATTDDRLQSVTLIGSNDLINVAENFLKKLDLRQRQVAISIKVLDINLKDGSGLSNSWAFKQNNNFIVNDQGKLLGAFGKYLPATEVVDFDDTNTTKTFTTDTTSSTPTDGFEFSRRQRINPGEMMTDENFVNLLTAEITSTNTKILASPTLILNEYPGQTGGTTVTFSDISEILKTGSIGRSFGNEAFVIVGTQVPINCTSEGDSSIPSFTYGLAGLTFGARVIGVDDNGFVTFSISPAVSAPSEKRTIIGCGDIDLLSIRRLDTGFIRVRDGNTLILTGVLNTEDKETTKKFPFFGDLPLIGQFFRSTTSEQAKRELVILVTPQILEDNEQLNTNINSVYKPSNSEAAKIIKGE